MGWPPQVGGLLPRAEEAIGVRYKLTTYSLDKNHEFGGPKARGFALILGITLADIDYLEAEIHLGIRRHPITSLVDNRPYGLNCVVEFPLRGVGSYSDREANLRTVWEMAGPFHPPRMINAFPKI
jgi:hypothetical protein